MKTSQMKFAKTFRMSQSLGVIIPANFVRALKIQRGDYVAVILSNDGYLRVSKVESSDIKLTTQLDDYKFKRHSVHLSGARSSRNIGESDTNGEGRRSNGNDP